jgi:hypothetical protein
MQSDSSRLRGRRWPVPSRAAAVHPARPPNKLRRTGARPTRPRNHWTQGRMERYRPRVSLLTSAFHQAIAWPMGGTGKNAAEAAGR